MNRNLNLFVIFLCTVLVISGILFFLFNLPASLKDHFEPNGKENVNVSESFAILSAIDNETGENINVNFILYDIKKEKIQEGELKGLPEQIWFDNKEERCEVKTGKKKEINKEIEGCNKWNMYYCNPEYPDYAYCGEKENNSCCPTPCLHNCEEDKHWGGRRCICNSELLLQTFSNGYYFSEVNCSLEGECKTRNEKVGEVEVFASENLTLEKNNISRLFIQSKEGNLKNLIVCIKWSRNIKEVSMELEKVETPEEYFYFDVCYNWGSDLKGLETSSELFEVEKDEEVFYDYIEFAITDRCYFYDNGFKYLFSKDGKDVCMEDKTVKVFVK